MISTMHRTTAQIPSSLGMPACGHAPVRTLAPTFERPWVKSAQIQAIDGLGFAGDLGTTPTYAPGTTAWSPPSC
ncbi:hypothetical protein [Nocardioides ferulae]|uniref:hypothetical protein n=1 Tax=Nocardioides ferulae TaxID=2340821 RepID=UPI000F85F5EB|nr:hypothetical protein [Nocardioides ferulae]